MIRISSSLVLSDSSSPYWQTNFWKCLSKDKPRLESKFYPTFWTQTRCSITLTTRIEFSDAPSNKISSTTIWSSRLSEVLRWEQRTRSRLYLRLFSKRVWFSTISNKISIGSTACRWIWIQICVLASLIILKPIRCTLKENPMFLWVLLRYLNSPWRTSRSLKLICKKINQRRIQIFLRRQWEN